MGTKKNKLKVQPWLRYQRFLGCIWHLVVPVTLDMGLHGPGSSKLQNGRQKKQRRHLIRGLLAWWSINQGLRVYSRFDLEDAKTKLRSGENSKGVWAMRRDSLGAKGKARWETPGEEKEHDELGQKTHCARSPRTPHLPCRGPRTFFPRV